MIGKFLYYLFFLIPKNYLSFIFGKISSISHPQFLSRFFIKTFAKIYKINLDEASKDINEYKSLSEFFVRDLKEGVREVKGKIVSPVDGFLRTSGKIQNLKMEPIKGKTYDVETLIGEELKENFKDGYFVNIYLSPHNYHNVHSPISGTIEHIKYIKGNLWPVTSWSLSKVKDLFLINERLVFKFNTSLGSLYMVMVGATNVGKMTTKFIENFSTNCLLQKGKTKDFIIEKQVDVMEKIASFNLGSTVVLILEDSFKDYLIFEDNKEIFLGERI